MDRSMMNGYALIIVGIVIIMYAIVAANTGLKIAEKSSGALMVLGGFITAVGFVTISFWSSDSDVLRAAALLVGGGIIIAMMVVL